MFTPSDVTKVVYVIDTSGAADQLEVLRGKQKVGPPVSRRASSSSVPFSAPSRATAWS